MSHGSKNNILGYFLREFQRLYCNFEKIYLKEGLKAYIPIDHGNIRDSALSLEHQLPSVLFLTSFLNKPEGKGFTAS